MKIDAKQTFLLSSIARRQKVFDLLDSAVCVCAAKLQDEAKAMGQMHVSVLVQNLG
jgi:hypothetical protein